MGNTNLTPWMNLPNPVPTVDPGPDYADNLQSCINGIDQHNHTPGSGQPITPSSFNVNAPFFFNGYPATDLQATIYTPQTSLATLYAVYTIGNDLYYNDGAGNVVQLTSGGLVNATASGISSGTASASFSAGVLIVKASSTSGANILMQSAVLTNTGNLTNQLTLAAPTLSGSPTLTLPSIPISTSFLIIDNSGNITAGSAIPATPVANAFLEINTSGQTVAGPAILGALTTSNLSSTAGITIGQNASPNSASSSSGSFAVTGVTLSQVCRTTITAQVSHRPVILSFQPQSSGSYISTATSDGSQGSTSYFIVKRDGTVITTAQLSTFAVNITTANIGVSILSPPGVLNFIDTDPGTAGTHNYDLQVQGGTASTTTSVVNVTFYAREMY